ncbi:MAG TPA: Sir2 family NAD-dependent protein deacetylase [Spirochaetales bacterium]|nr:Sir2 family NAD-dependent protein deacetylase [Spirochaetales bacterium]HRY55799.1 Sir2 family NAD-dependent protein deacetylase [Spirochaetia bacterium]HRZ65864.1 Sir2 family NAD-dependent protein deacetylase [Spirochaetia bacterium]
MGGLPRIDLAAYGQVLFLTGAGVSVASGIRPYRGPDGLWNDEELVRYAHIETFRSDPLGVWRHWWKMRELALAARPNPAHEELARLEAARREAGGGAGFALVTQNVDGLHARAGSRELVEYHGSALRTRCSNPSCGLPAYEDGSCAGEEVPACPRCGAPLRPDIVFFGEPIPEGARRAAEAALGSCELFVAVGTSATVYPAAGFVEAARRRGARTIYLNLQPIEALGGSGSFGEAYLGRAEELLPRIFGGSRGERSGRA